MSKNHKYVVFCHTSKLSYIFDQLQSTLFKISRIYACYGNSKVIGKKVQSRAIVTK